ncbi:hypothetical protein ONZ51_g3722 [Trametes cubensis]|uniref:Uncharacterized protein n=1 Tax=Trametes cubensis TaxID=1111947 RepID=A0AAD7TX60_9APHY|nr:hypothetical protein ONZ51_g3722 [Trametes cubensis]
MTKEQRQQDGGDGAGTRAVHDWLKERLADGGGSDKTRLTLAERIDWTERDDDAESTVSFGYEDDDVDMEIANAAGLYEQYDEQVRSNI